MLTVEALKDVRHGFFTRVGGVSKGMFSSLNCGYRSGDTPENVSENRRRALKCLGLMPYSLATLHQIHSNRIVTVHTPQDHDPSLQADGLVTQEKNLTLGVVTADCAPVLFCTSSHKYLIGAAHIGWKGAIQGIMEAMITKMTHMSKTAAHNLIVMIGPCIAQESYEVGPEFRAHFLKQDPSNYIFFKRAVRSTHSMFDLRGYIVRRAQMSGVSDIHHCLYNTCTEEQILFSARRAYLQNQPHYGHCLSVITNL